MAKTYNSGDSPVVTHLTTSPPVRCLNRAERTGSLVFNVLWSYVEELGGNRKYIAGTVHLCVLKRVSMAESVRCGVVGKHSSALPRLLCTRLQAFYTLARILWRQLRYSLAARGMTSTGLESPPSRKWIVFCGTRLVIQHWINKRWLRTVIVSQPRERRTCNNTISTSHVSI
jgi:hypothetical protein